MKRLQPPWLAVALLNRFVPDNEPLAGDLIDEFEARQSRLWFWRQVLLAILISSFQNDREIRPLKLVGDHSTFGSVKSQMSPRNLPKRTNLSGSPVEGIGGLGLIALGVLVTVVVPQVWWAVLGAVLGGVVLGIVMVVISRHRLLSSPSGGRPGVLFGEDGPESR